MNKHLLPIFASAFFISCTTYVPIEYRTLGEFGVAKNTPIKITNTEKKDLTVILQREIAKDGWWKYATDEKNYYEILLTEIERNGSETSSSTEVQNEKTIRKASYKANGSCTFVIKKNNDGSPKTFSVTAEGYASSEKEMPKKDGANSLWPLINSLIGNNPTEEAINNQLTFLSMDAYQDLDQHLAKEIVKKITPEKKIVKIEFEDGKDDMDPVEKFIKAQDFQTAFTYLQGLKDKETRSDAQYNLGIVQEARHIYKDACTYYQKAYELNAKPLYLEQRSACESRKAEIEKTDNLI